MRNEEAENSPSGNDWSIYPIFHLDAKWTNATDYLELGIRLLKADRASLKMLAEVVGGGAAPLIFPDSFDPACGDVCWILAVRVPEPVQRVSAAEIGLSFKDRVETAIAQSFLTSLKLVRSTAAICPVSCSGVVRESRISELRDVNCDILTTVESPRCDWPESFEDEDWRRIKEVWSGLVKVRRLDHWMTAPFQSEFSSRLDILAVKRVLAPFKTLKIDSRDKVEAIIGEDGWNHRYREAFRAEFQEEEDLTFNASSRIGRAIGVFEEGVHLPQLHAFLSVCLVLETLLTTDSQEVTHKLATRLAKIVGDEAGPEVKRGLYKKAKDVYRERSHVVHGEKSVAQVDEQVRRNAFALTRSLLQKILRSEKYLRLFTVAPKGELDEFFTGLDLG